MNGGGPSEARMSTGKPDGDCETAGAGRSPVATAATIRRVNGPCIVKSAEIGSRAVHQTQKFFPGGRAGDESAQLG
jgi:hypothetical protein